MSKSTRFEDHAYPTTYDHAVTLDEVKKGGGISKKDTPIMPEGQEATKASTMGSR